MRIGLFTDGYEPQVSGLVTSVKMLKTEFEKQGHEVFIITLSDKNYLDEENNVLYFKGRLIPIKGLNEYRIRRHRRKDLKIIKELNFDQIHVHTEYSMGKLALKSASKFNIPIVYTSHTMVLDYLHYSPWILRPFVKIIFKRIIKKYHKRADYTIYPTKKVLVAYENLIKRDFKFEIIPTGVDLKNFEIDVDNNTKEEMKKDLNITTEKICLYLGRLAEEKSVDLLIETFKDINDTTLLIAGDGPERNDLEKLVDKLELRDKVKFAGMIDWSEIGKYYKIADVFLNASITETQGLTYIEALAAGTPVICRYDTNLDDVVIDGHNGFFFTDKEDLIKCIDKFYNLDVKKLSDNAIEVSKNFSSETYANKVLKLYNKK